MARSLTACIPSDPDFAQTMIPLLQLQEQDALARRSCDVNIAVVEVIWAQSHQAKEIVVSQITELTNACEASTGSSTAPWRNWTDVRRGGEARFLQK
jgi:hypothetical protein